MKQLPEFARHERTVICWPSRRALYGEFMDEAERAHAALARTISAFEPVTMIANSEHVGRAKSMCGEAVDVVSLPIDDSWFRDTGPIYVLDDSGKRVAGCWVFNGWGNKYSPYDCDVDVAAAWAKLAGHPIRKIDMVLEGGSINVDGSGYLVTTEQCLLNPNRNPQLTRQEIAQRLCTEFGVEEVIWLPHGLSLDNDTDGHVDNVAAFIAPRTVVLQRCDDEDEEDFDRLARNRAVIDQFGLSVCEIPVLPVIEFGGRRIQVPYLNFYFCNGAVIVPTCGHPADADMLALLGEFIPDTEIIGLDIGGILGYGGGGIHCITQQIPA
ncbi:MAG: agmatine deiminase family protein [Ilumatobacteraceae bacterium]